MAAGQVLSHPTFYVQVQSNKPFLASLSEKLLRDKISGTLHTETTFPGYKLNNNIAMRNLLLDSMLSQTGFLNLCQDSAENFVLDMYLPHSGSKFNEIRTDLIQWESCHPLNKLNSYMGCSTVLNIVVIYIPANHLAAASVRLAFTLLV